MENTFYPLPSDLANVHAMILAQREQLAQQQTENLAAQSEVKVTQLEIDRKRKADAVQAV